MLGLLALGLWLAAVAFAYFVLGERMDQVAEGVFPARFGRWAAPATVLLGGTAALATFCGRGGARARRPVAGAAPDQAALGRRGFLTGAAAITAGVAATGGAVFARMHGWILSPAARWSARRSNTSPRVRRPTGAARACSATDGSAARGRRSRTSPSARRW
jgi:hypothetical protein